MGTDKQVEHRIQTQTATSTPSDRTRRCGLDRTALLADAGKPYCRKCDAVKLSFVTAGIPSRCCVLLFQPCLHLQLSRISVLKWIIFYRNYVLIRRGISVPLRVLRNSFDLTNSTQEINIKKKIQIVLTKSKQCCTQRQMTKVLQLSNEIKGNIPGRTGNGCSFSSLV